MGRKIRPRCDVDEVNILLVGDDGVGKSSLILSLINEEFAEQVPARLEEVTIPADVTPEKVPTHIVDFSAQTQSNEDLRLQVQQSSVVCIVYDVNDDTTLERVTDYWLPEISRSIGENERKPVILVGNKSDSQESENLDRVLPLMHEYADIETCVECSAKSMKNISELFYYAQKAVLHPIGPLYVPEDRQLTQQCKKALVRIFKLSDIDNDGLLNDYELNQFQHRCFNVPLTAAALADVKNIVRKFCDDGIMHDALTLKGFLFLQTLFVQRGRHETTWTVLRRFGYDRTLHLAKDYLHAPLKVPRGCTTELSPDGLQFVAGLFEKHDEDRDGCLSPAELTNLFSVCAAQPWSNADVAMAVHTNESGYITYNGYLAYWALSTYMEPVRTMEQLAYLGFNVQFVDQVAAISVSRDRRVDWQQRKTDRTVFYAHVIGPKDAGKSTFMQGFIGRSLRAQAALSRKNMGSFVANSIKVDGADKYLILHEVDVLSPDDALTRFELSADAVCLLYDAANPHSFEYVATVYKKHFHRTRVPCLLVAARGWGRHVLQAYELQPDEFAAKHRLLPPMHLRTEEVGRADADVYRRLAALCVYPHLKHVPYLHDAATWLKLGVGAAVLAAFGFALYKNL